MKLRWIILIAVLVIAFLTIPYYSYAKLPTSDNKDTATLTVTFRAMRMSATDYSKAGFSIDWSVAGYEKPSYFSFIGTWWGGLLKPGQADVPKSFPFVAITIVDATNSGSRVMSDDYYPYTYGEVFTKSYTFEIPVGHNLMGQIQIYHAQSTSIYISEYYMVMA